MKTVNLEKLQEEAKERHKYRQRKPYTKKTWFEKTLEQKTATFKKQITQQNSIQYP